jgi:hypothetical protein
VKRIAGIMWGITHTEAYQSANLKLVAAATRVLEQEAEYHGKTQRRNAQQTPER